MKETTLHTTIHKSLLTIPDLLWLANYNFSYRELLKELPRDVIVLFHALKKIHEEDVTHYYDILNDEKKWDAIARKYTHYKVKPQQFEALFEEVVAFAGDFSSATLLYEITAYFQKAPYQLTDDKLWFTFEEESDLSPHAALWIRMLQISLGNRLQAYTLKAAIDDTLPAPIQVLHSVCLDEKKSLRYFLSLERPLTSIVEVFVSYYKLSRLLSDQHATADESQQNQIASTIPKLELAIYRLTTTFFLAVKNRSAEREGKTLQNTKRKYDELMKKYDKQREKLDELRKQHQDLKKATTTAPVIETKIVEDHSETVKALKKECSDLNNLVRQLEIAMTAAGKKYEQDTGELKHENKVLQQKLQPLLKIVAQPKIETIPQWLALGKQLIQQVSATEEQEIRAFFDLFMKLCDEQKAAQPKQELATNRFGYVSISSKGHHVHFPNGQDEIITALPAHIYLAEGQFVQVTADFEYVADYNDFFDFQLRESTAQFSIVRMKEEAPHVFFNGTLQPIKHEAHIRLREGQIVSFNQNVELLRFYRQQRLQLNLFEQSIALKGHIPYYVQKALPTGAVVTHAFTNVENYMTLQNIDSIKDDSFITVMKDEIVRLFHGSFYKLSTYYTKSEIVSVCDLDGDIFGKKVNREMVIIKNIPANVSLTLNSLVRIDEQHHYLELIKEQSPDTETVEQRLARRQITTTKDTATPLPVEEIAQVLIVGNPSFFASHKQKLAAHGIDATGIDGYESFTRVKQAAKEKDYIVVCTEFVSHDNMYNIKDTYSLDHVIYSERDGATQILNQLHEKIVIAG